MAPDLGRVLNAAVEIQDFCLARDWKFCFIGGLAYQPWGDPRQTIDADLTLLTGFGDEENFVDPLLAHFEPRRADAREFALRHRVVLLWSHSGAAIDIGLGAFPFEENCIRRSILHRFSPELALRVCSPEDLIVHKAFASRDLDWSDVDRILQRQGRKLNVPQILAELRPLAELKEDPAILPRLEALMRKRDVWP
jgi:hypothetical protein